MTNLTQQQYAGNLIGAFAHLLTGKAGTTNAFLAQVDVCLSGRQPVAPALLSMLPGAEANQRLMLWFHPNFDAIGGLQIGLVSPTVPKRLVAENSFLWMGERDDRATLIVDGFNFGAFRCGRKLALRYVEKAPARTLAEAVPGITRAYARLEEIARDQIERGERFPLPQCYKVA